MREKALFLLLLVIIGSIVAYMISLLTWTPFQISLDDFQHNCANNVNISCRDFGGKLPVTWEEKTFANDGTRISCAESLNCSSCSECVK